MNVIKYCWPFQNSVWNGPQISVYISSKTSEHLLAPNLLTLVCFPLIHSMQTWKSAKSREGRIPSDTSLSVRCLEICPKHLCHSKVEFSLNFCFAPLDVECKVSVWEAIVSSKYSLSLLIKERVPIRLESWKRLNFPFPWKQENQICPI